MKIQIDGNEIECSEIRLNTGDLQVVITHEGIIMDVFDGPLDDESAASKGMMFDEWVEYLKGSMEVAT